MTLTADRPTTAPNEAVPDGLNHYARGADITAAIVNGGTVTAVCGVTVLPRAQGGGSVASARLPICTACSSLMNYVTQLDDLDRKTWP